MQKIKQVLNYANEMLISFFSNVIISFYKLKNRKQPKILIYTDSRGYEITSILNKRNPFSSYCGQLIKTYNATVHICPEKHTTIIDFLDVFDKRKCEYDLVILHCGVVDFSRRPLGQLRNIYQLKHNKMVNLGFSEQDLINNCVQNTGFYYNGEKTGCIYTSDQFLNIIIPKLKLIKELVFIGCNPVLLDWRGSYWQDRPQDINSLLDYCEIAKKEIKNTIDLSEWSPEDIKTYTDDNIHPNKQGYSKLTNYLQRFLPPIN